MRETESKMIYEPDKFLKMCFFSTWKEMFYSLLISRELIWRLFLRDFNAQYRQSFLGWFWAVINPIVTVSIFIFLRRSGILNIPPTNVPYIVWAIIGISVYGVFSSGLTACANSISKAGPMVVKINFPKISLVIAAMGVSLVDFLVRLTVVIIMLFVYKVTLNWTIILLPVAVLPLIFLTLGTGLMMALFACVFKDILQLIPFLSTLLLFLVPAIYPTPQMGLLSAVHNLNPLSHLITGCRDILILGNLSNPLAFLWSSLFSVFILLISWRLFFLSETRIAERV